jgi:hypothetical protein
VAGFNSILTAASWEISRRIVEFEQHGEARAARAKWPAGLTPGISVTYIAAELPRNSWLPGPIPPWATVADALA